MSTPHLSQQMQGAALAALAVLLAACPGPRQPVAQVALAGPVDTVLAPYGEVTDGAWLDGDRFVVIAPQDPAVGVADFRRRTISRFGGARAAELSQPFHLFRAGDSIYVADWLRRRLTGWSPAGAPGGTLSATDGLRGALPRARDGQGRWYFELRAPPGPDGSGNRDSATIVRTAPDQTTRDTVTRLAPLDIAEVISDGRRRFERRLLSGQDRWGVLPDGAVWVARVQENRVDWVDADGRTRRGRQLPDPVLPVTQNDRDIFLRRFDPGLRPTVEQIPFAAIKPPFEFALASPAGEVWLVKSRAVGDTVRLIQVIDRTGAELREIRHPGLGRVLAVGGGFALVGEPFEGGTRLLRYRLPV